MKKLFIISLVIIAIFASSCGEDEVTSNSLARTTWKGNEWKLNFINSTNYELIDIEYNEMSTGKFSVTDNGTNINFTYIEEGDEQDLGLKGKIDGNIITLSYSPWDTTYTVTKQ